MKTKLITLIGVAAVMLATVVTQNGCAHAHDGSKTAHEVRAYAVVAPPGWMIIKPDLTNSATQNDVASLVVESSTNPPSWLSELLDRPHVYLAYREVWEDKSQGGGTFVLTDPSASQLSFARANQNGLGGTRTVTVGSLQSTITTNAIGIVSAGGTAVGNVIGAAAAAAAK